MPSPLKDSFPRRKASPISTAREKSTATPHKSKSLREFERSSNIQAPGSREAPSFKLQTSGEQVVEIGSWNFSGAWRLVPGFFAFQFMPRKTARNASRPRHSDVFRQPRFCSRRRRESLERGFRLLVQRFFTGGRRGRNDLHRKFQQQII